MAVFIKDSLKNLIIEHFGNYFLNNNFSTLVNSFLEKNKELNEKELIDAIEELYEKGNSNYILKGFELTDEYMVLILLKEGFDYGLDVNDFYDLITLNSEAADKFGTTLNTKDKDIENLLIKVGAVKGTNGSYFHPSKVK